MVKKFLILCLILSLTLLPSCKAADQTIKKVKNTDTSEIPIILSETEKDTTAKVSKTAKKSNGQYLLYCLEDFIDCYNAYYRKDHGRNYIQPYSEWYSYVQDFGKYQGDICYEFTADKKILTLPTIAVYTPQSHHPSSRQQRGRTLTKKPTEILIKELTVNFDDHSYTDRMYKQYEEMCFYTLKVFFPDIKDKKLTKLYKKLNQKAYHTIFQNAQGFHSKNPPTDLYYRNGVGVYPYFAYGESLRMCIITASKKVIKRYEKRGVKIHKL